MDRFTQRLLKHCGPFTYRRFIKHCKDYIEAVAREADLREHGTVLDVDAYVTLRRENSAVRFCCGLAGYALGIDLPDEVVEHPAFMAMHLATVDMVCWSNVSTVARLFHADQRGSRVCVAHRTSTPTTWSRPWATPRTTS